MSSERAPTGIEGLDEMIEGGFPKGSMIILAGNPGTGKTVFATSFLCKARALMRLVIRNGQLCKFWCKRTR